MATKAHWTSEKEKHLAAARAFAAKAEREGRNFTAGERTAVDGHMTQAKAAQAELRILEGDEQILAELNSYTAGAGGRKARNVSERPWAKAMTAHLAATGQKALTTTGAITVPSLSGGIVHTSERPRSILNLIPFIDLTSGDQFAYLRETARTQNATTVAVGKRKPESDLDLEKVEDRVRTIAHTTLVDRSLVMDVELLQQYLEDALREGVELELEDQVLNGDGSVVGVLDNLVGILNTSGTQAQAWDTDRVVTARKAVSKLESVNNGNLDPSGFAFAMSVGEWEAFELLQDTDHYVLGSGSGQGSANGALPIDRAARRLWGYPVVTSFGLTTGAALLGDFGGSAEIREREDVVIEFATSGYVEDLYGVGLHGDLMDANKVKIRAEGRWGLAVKRPAAFIEVDLTAA